MKQQQSPLRQVQVHMLWDTPKFPLPFHFPQIEQSAEQKSQVYQLINFMKCQAHQCLPMEVSTMKTPCHHLTRSARSVRAGELDPGLGHITSSRVITHIVRAQLKMLSKIKIQRPSYLTYLT